MKLINGLKNYSLTVLCKYVKIQLVAKVNNILLLLAKIANNNRKNGGNFMNNSKTIRACTYYCRSGAAIINATDHLLRLKEKDGTIVEIPSSVMPKGELPKVYKETAAELYTTPAKLFDGSIFINIKKEEYKVREFIYKDLYKTVGNSVLEIISRIREEYPYEVFIVASEMAARNFGELGVVEPVYLDEDEGIIMNDKFKSYS